MFVLPERWYFLRHVAPSRISFYGWLKKTIVIQYLEQVVNWEVFFLTWLVMQRDHGGVISPCTFRLWTKRWRGAKQPTRGVPEVLLDNGIQIGSNEPLRARSADHEEV
jgi:hypothetical protein